MKHLAEIRNQKQVKIRVASSMQDTAREFEEFFQLIPTNKKVDSIHKKAECNRLRTSSHY